MLVLKWRKKTLVAMAAVIGLFWYVITTLMDDLTCSHSDSLSLLHRLCEDYHKGLIAGNLCPQLCDTKSLTFQKCTNYKDGKKVLIAKWHKETVILKTKKAHWSDYGTPEELFNEVTLREFMNIVKNSISSSLEIKVEEFPKLNQQDLSMLSELWSTDFKDFTQVQAVDKGGDRKKILAAMRSLWTLLEQNEYVMLKFLRNRKHVPEVAGTCGHVYAMEYLPHGDTLDPEVLEMAGLKDETPWRERLRVAVSLMEALRSYDEGFHETLHLCDVKGENFGLSKTGVVKILDLDNTFFTSRLKRELAATSCSSHVDCDFFDCQGYCNKTTGQCTTHRINNNLQVVCSKIFSNGITNKYLGLLRKAPLELKDQLETLLEMCVKVNNKGQPFTQHHTPVTVLDRIYKLLQNDLISDRQQLANNLL